MKKPLTAIATVAGQPWEQAPDGLYLPPEAFRVSLNVFAGPLDLLLYLIRRKNIDIFDIPVAAISDQFLHYISDLSELKIEQAANYLAMAATLTEIKSRLLLPARDPGNGDRREDPRAELAAQLQAFATAREAAAALMRRPLIGRDFFAANAPPEMPLKADDLQRALKQMIARFQHSLPERLRPRRSLSMRRRAQSLLAELQGGTPRRLHELLVPSEGSLGLALTLSALLHLAQHARVKLTQKAPFAPLHVRTD